MQAIKIGTDLFVNADAIAFVQRMSGKEIVVALSVGDQGTTKTYVNFVRKDDCDKAWSLLDEALSCLCGP